MNAKSSIVIPALLALVMGGGAGAYAQSTSETALTATPPKAIPKPTAHHSSEPIEKFTRILAIPAPAQEHAAEPHAHPEGQALTNPVEATRESRARSRQAQRAAASAPSTVSR